MNRSVVGSKRRASTPPSTTYDDGHAKIIDFGLAKLGSLQQWQTSKPGVADAARLLELLQSRRERLFAMEAYARSFFLLGQIYERRGDTARARDQYSGFIDLWRDGTSNGDESQRRGES